MAAELMLIGEHCSFDGCNQLDFLPFYCHKCSRKFCLEHRREADHQCINADIGNIEISECPLCGKKIKKGSHQSANDQIERHILSGCKDYVISFSNSKHSHKCTVKTCRQYELVSFNCPYCQNNYCIKHRHTVNHHCMGVIQAN